MRAVFKRFVRRRMTRALLLLLVVVGGILWTQGCSGDGGSAEGDRAAMVALFHSTNGTVANVVFEELSHEQRATIFEDGYTSLERWEALLENIDVITEQWSEQRNKRIELFESGDLLYRPREYGTIETDGRGRITSLNVGGPGFGPQFRGRDSY